MDFASFDGFALDMETGKVELLMSPASPGKPGLFDHADISEIFKRGVTSAFFSLEEPDSTFATHPFNAMMFGPSSLQDSSLLATMFHADYLLKFFSTGVEVSSVAPFSQRPTSSGLMKLLPNRLHKFVQSTFEREGRSKVGAAHRFWIEAGSIPKDETTEATKHRVRFGYVPMVIKKHLLMRNEKARLFCSAFSSSSSSSSLSRTGRACRCDG